MWQETVMGEIQRNNIFYHGIGTLEGVCQMQAQITGDIAYKAGIEKVVSFTQPLLEKIEDFVCAIEGNGADPRYECQKIYELVKEWLAFKESLRQEEHE